jgi:O-antigen biosynthesis protein
MSDLPSVDFVVTEALGLHPNGGIATATTYLAAALADRGHRVGIVYAGWDQAVDDRWRGFYRTHGVDIAFIDRTEPVSPWWVGDGFRVKEMLQRRAPDVAVFQDWQGLAAASVTIRRAGLGLQRTALVHFCHGPTQWLREANDSLDVDLSEWALGVMERQSARWCDAIVGPSRYLVDWMSASGWSLAEDRRTIPYVTAAHFDPPPPVQSPPRGRDVDELVFFGRLEARKGVMLLLDALGQMDPALLSGRTLTFLGREATITHEQILGSLPAGVLEVADVRFLDRLDQRGARDHLARDGVLALIPSLTDNSPNVIYECIDDGIRFLTSDAGGGPELVHPDDRERVVVAVTPAAWARRLTEILSGVTPAVVGRPSYDAATSLAQWDELLAHLAAQPARFRTPASPRVAAVVPYYNQPKLIGPTVAALDAQDYEHLEIVIVDDGSTPENAAVVDRLAASTTRHTITVVHQANAYLGAARNAGMRSTDAQFVVFVDDDDIVDPGYVSALVAAQAATGASVVTTGMRTFSTPEGLPRLVDEMGRWMFLGSDGAELGTAQNVFGGAAALADRQLLLDLGGFHQQRGLGFEDWQMWAKVALEGHEVVALPVDTYWYRIRRQSMRRTMPEVRSAQLIFDVYDDKLPDHLQPLTRLARGTARWTEERNWLLGRVRDLEDELDRRARYAAFLELLLPNIEDGASAGRVQTLMHACIDGSRRSDRQLDAILDLLRDTFDLQPVAPSEMRARLHGDRTEPRFDDGDAR